MLSACLIQKNKERQDFLLYFLYVYSLKSSSRPYENTVLSEYPIRISRSKLFSKNNEEYYSHKDNEDKEYTAIYFPERYDPLKEYVHTGELSSEIDCASQTGNCINSNLMINDFLKKFLIILDIYNKGDLPQDAYGIILAEYLEQSAEEPPEHIDIPF